MASNINPNNIDATFPVAGQDNDTQGFRNNYLGIQTNFTTASQEITALQVSVNNVQSSLYANAKVAAYMPSYLSTFAGNIGALTILGNLTIKGYLYSTQTITTISTNLVANSGYPTTSANTGALQIWGGAYISGNANIGGYVVANSIVSGYGTSANITIDPDGAGDVVFPSNTELWVYSTNQATSAYTGAIRSFGGIGIQGNIYTAANITASGNATITGNLSSGNVNTDKVIATGNIVGANIFLSGTVFYANGDQYFSYGNANVTAYIPTDTYISGLVTTINSNIVGANAAIVSANSAVVTYVNTRISTADSNLTTANTGMKTYVDNKTSYGNIYMAGPGANLYIIGNATVTSNLVVGNLIVQGTTSSLNQQNITLANSVVFLSNANPVDTLDIGFAGQYSGTYGLKATGLIRQSSTKQWFLFSNVATFNGNNVTLTNNVLDTLNLGALTANGNVTSANVNATLFGNIYSTIGTYSSNVTVSNLLALNSGTVFANTYIGTRGIFSGNVTSGNIFVTGNLTQTGNLANLTITTANIIGNIQVTGTITSSGNITSTANVVSNANIYATTGNVISTAFFGNLVGSTITSANVTVVGNLSVSSGNLTANTNGNPVGYLDMPQNLLPGSYALTLADRGRHLYTTTSSNVTYYIPNNATTSWPVGTTMAVIIRGTGNVIISANSNVWLYMGGNSLTGANTRVVSSYGMASILNVSANVWFVSGAGVY